MLFTGAFRRERKVGPVAGASDEDRYLTRANRIHFSEYLFCFSHRGLKWSVFDIPVTSRATRATNNAAAATIIQSSTLRRRAMEYRE